jgi:anaerobic dimethyl sulfoxide reductase subunit A
LTSNEFYHNHRTGKPYPIKAFWVSSHNPANSHANRNNFLELMRSMELVVVVDLIMSATAEYADIVLPGCTSYECTSLAMPYTALMSGGHPYFQLQPKIVEPLYESKSDLDIFNELAKRMGLGEFFDKSEEDYIEMILSSGHPSMEGITLEKLREGPMKPKPSSAPLQTHDTSGSLSQEELKLKLSDTSPLFNTSSGRLEIYSEKLKEFGQGLPVYLESPDSIRQPRAKSYPLNFLQLHSRTRHHSDFTDVDWLRQIDPEPVLNINSIDAEKRGIRDGDMVVTFNDRGKVKLKARIHEGMKPGVVSVGEGWRPKDFAEGTYQELTGNTTNPAQQAVIGSIGQMQGILVEVKKAPEDENG